MSALYAALAALAAGYGLGRYRPAQRTFDWAYRQRWAKHRPTGARYWAMYAVNSAENIGWLVAHPVQGWDAWKHRNDPPPPKSPPVRIRTDHATEEPGRRCVCGDPVQWMDHPDGSGWIHSPGSETTCLDARPTPAS